MATNTHTPANFCHPLSVVAAVATTTATIIRVQKTSYHIATPRMHFPLPAHQHPQQKNPDNAIAHQVRQ
ncbi:hypothetical protein BDD12DRAFT_815947 [Trichophaea hybrida]|nr:hypothetical protein BDD12DRAFT_815947 [Trichophaea hybrida]